MKLKNYTDFSTDELRKIVAFAKPSGVSNFDISFKNNGKAGVRGMAYPNGCSYHDNSSVQLVIVSVGDIKKFPYTRYAFGAYLEIQLYNKFEAFLYVTAHELRHLWQKKHPRGRRVWGARGQYSEKDADAYALRIIRQYRREGLGK